MRADRLVATLLVLQARGRITARELAEELEVSERTARRDLEALAMSGVPIYSRPGRGGGWRLLGGASTDLTGLTGDEARALFLTLGSTSTATPTLRAAARKLAQALPEPFRDEVGRADASTIVDRARWGREGRRGDDHRFLEALQEAVVTRRRIVLGYRTPGRDGPEPPTERIADPLGLVAKAGTWYLVAGTERGQRTFRVGRVTSVELLDEPAERPDDFDLDAAWRAIVVGLTDNTWSSVASGRAEPWLLPPMRYLFGSRLTVGPRRRAGPDEVGHGGGSTTPGDPGAAEIHDIEVRGTEPRVLAAELAGFVVGVTIDGPDEIIAELAHIGRQLTARYGGSPARSAQ